MQTAGQGAGRRGAAPAIWVSVALASLILSITMGIRQTVGLFVHPIIAGTGMTVVDVSMALAIGQLLWGVFQPIFGAWADKKSAFAALAVGAVCLAGGQLLTLWATTPATLILAQGFLSPAGAAAGSFSVLLGIVAGRLTADTRSMASGLINAGGSIGQFAFAPLVQFVMHLRDYYASLVVLAGAALLTILPSWVLCRGKEAAPAIEKGATAAPPQPDVPLAREGLRDQLRVALRDKSYLLLHGGFFTCGFHVAFLTTHLPGEVSLCGHSAAVSAASLSLIGLCNIAGSIGAGILGKYYRMKYILAALYASRAAMIAVYLLSPKTEMTFYLFAAATGFTWLATVPPTAGVVGKLFGMRYLATLFGLTLFTHQIGAFFGAWLGGVAMQQSGSLLWVWYIDVALALFAAVVNLPIKEQPVPRRNPVAGAA
ncbi:Major facilitator superfamily MFS_1 [uncultured delta proteobacterium]|uniref:Major facilitator superfamily MFS_1 n=1 Tax=uncultured delta proteobacterium TaxID=34034 RepID=A0A212K7F7_9DELT|nr:Major facilitator superfamily MFS_1 [uncultured delta proteobacterium]